MKKDAVKLAVIGGAKQGKTQLLQEMTGLKYGLAAEWPHLGMDPSVYTVCHVPEMEEGSVRAVIRFRKREKLLELFLMKDPKKVIGKERRTARRSFLMTGGRCRLYPEKSCRKRKAPFDIVKVKSSLHGEGSERHDDKGPN